MTANFGFNFGKAPKFAEVHFAEVHRTIWEKSPLEALKNQHALLKTTFMHIAELNFGNSLP